VILALFTASAVSAVAVPETAYGHIAMIEEETILVAQTGPVKPSGSTEEIVRGYFQDIPVMIEIARCESQFRHELIDGSVLQGRVDPADTGVMQINKRYHLGAANAMNLDLHNVYDNMAYARHLYKSQGTQPWSSSAPCWNRQVASI
jgi:hypothetical protein